MYKITIRTEVSGIAEAIGAVARYAGCGVTVEAEPFLPLGVSNRDWSGVTAGRVLEAVGLSGKPFVSSSSREAFILDLNAAFEVKNLIRLIRVIREHTGMGLREAKELAERVVPRS